MSFLIVNGELQDNGPATGAEVLKSFGRGPYTAFLVKGREFKVRMLLVSKTCNHVNLLMVWSLLDVTSSVLLVLPLHAGALLGSALQEACSLS